MSKVSKKFLISVSDYASDQLHYSRISQCPYRFPPTRSIRPVSLRTLICFCMIRRVTPNLSPNASCETPGCSFNISIILSTIASSKAPCFVVFRCFGPIYKSTLKCLEKDTKTMSKKFIVRLLSTQGLAFIKYLFNSSAPMLNM